MQIGNATILHIDCMEYMKTLKDKAFDCAFTDPPYNVGRKYNTHNDSMLNYEQWCDEWFSELMRVSNTVVLTGGYKNFKYWINKNPKHVIIWSKPNQSSPSPLGGFSAYEPVFYFGKLQKRIGHDLITTNISMQNDASWHNCPKHLPSWEKLLSTITDNNSYVFDPFLGSGTTAIACNNLGYEMVGCELDYDYYIAACKRIEHHNKQLRLFA